MPFVPGPNYASLQWQRPYPRVGGIDRDERTGRDIRSEIVQYLQEHWANE